MPVSSVPAFYSRVFKEAIRRARSERLKIRVAPQGGYFQRWPRAHFHGTPELFLQTGGATDFDCPGGKFRLSAGEVGIVPAGVPHAEKAIDVRTPYSAVVVMHASDGFTLLESFADEHMRIGCRNVKQIPGKNGAGAFSFLMEASQDSDRLPGLHRSAYQRHLVSAFLIASLGDLHRTPGDADPLTPLASGARKLAMAQLSDPDLGVSSLARQLGCHPDHLSRSFQKSLGVPLGEWIIRERIQTARGLLQNSPHNVAEVCWACGFSNPSYFIKVFRTRTGQTPGQFRKASAT